MRKPQTLASLTALTVCLAVASSQAGQILNGGGGGGAGTLTYTLSVSSPGPGQAFKRTLAGDFDGDKQTDVAYQLGTDVEVMLAPGLYEALMQDAASGVVDMVVLPGASADKLLTVGTAGLREIAFNSGGTPGSGATFWNATSVSLGASWTGVTRLATMEQGADFHVFGLHSDGLTIHHLRQTNGTWYTGALGVNASGTTFSEIVALDYDGDGLPDVAGMAADSLRIYDPLTSSTVPVAVQSLAQSTFIAMARVQQEGTTKDWLALVATQIADGVTQYLCTYGWSGIANWQNIGTNRGFNAVGAGDCLGDADDDIVLSGTQRWKAYYFPNQGTASGPVFDVATQSVEEMVAGSAATNETIPLLADVDNDGDDDVCFIVQDLPWMWVRRSDKVDHTIFQALIQATADSSGPNGQTGVEILNKNLEFDIDLPENLPGTHLELAVWTQPTGGGTLTPYNFDGPNSNTAQYPNEALAGGLSISLAGTNLTYSTELIDDIGIDERVFIALQFIDLPQGSSTPTATYPGALFISHGQGIESEVNGPGNTDNQIFALALTQQSPYKFDVKDITDNGIYLGLGGIVSCLPASTNIPPIRE